MARLSGCVAAVATFRCLADAFHLLRIFEQTVPVLARQSADGKGDGSCGEDGGETPSVTLDEYGRPRKSRPREREQREERGEDNRRQRHRQGAAEGNMVDNERDRNSSLELAAEGDLDERGGGSESSPGRLPREGVRGNGHARPTPSYALPTKHFKALDRYCVWYIPDLVQVYYVVPSGRRARVYTRFE